VGDPLSRLTLLMSILLVTVSCWLTGVHVVPVSHCPIDDDVLVQLLLVVFSCFREVGLMTGFRNSLNERDCGCGSRSLAR